MSIYKLPADVKMIILNYLNCASKKALGRISESYEVSAEFCEPTPPHPFLSRSIIFLSECAENRNLFAWACASGRITLPLEEQDVWVLFQVGYSQAMIWYVIEYLKGKISWRCRKLLALFAMQHDRPAILLEMLDLWKRSGEEEDNSKWIDFSVGLLRDSVRKGQTDLADLFIEKADVEITSSVFSGDIWREKYQPKWKEILEWLEKKGAFTKCNVDLFYHAYRCENVKMLDWLLERKYPCSVPYAGENYLVASSGETREWFDKYNPQMDPTYNKKVLY